MIDLMPFGRSGIQSLNGDFVYDSDGMLIITEEGIKKLSKMGVKL